jgi:hypothetical protein
MPLTSQRSGKGHQPAPGRGRVAARARAYFEFITELERRYDVPDIDRRLEQFADLDPQLVARLGGNKVPANPTRLVGGLP